MAFVGNLENNTLSGGGVAPFGGGYGFGGGFGGFGGFGGIAPIGLVGINNLFDRDRGHDHGGHGCKGRDNDGPEHPLAILAAIASSKDVTVAEARALSAAVSESEKTNLQQFYAAAIQASNNTQSIKDQSTAQHAAILAAINNSDVQRLRDELHETRRGRDLDGIRIENNNTNTNIQAQFQAQAQAQLQAQLDEHRRRFDNREIEINNINTNTAVATQLQQQQQQQAIRDRDRDYEFHKRFDALFNQSNKVAQDIVQIGSGVIGAAQTSTPTNNNISK